MPKTLNDVCEFIVDCLHATALTQDEGYSLIRTPNIGKGRLILDGVYRVSEETYEKWTRRAVPQANDLILAREAPAGNIAIVKNGQQVCLGQRTVHLRPDAQQVDPDFLCYYLLAPQQQGALLAGETGATSKHVNMKDIRRLPLRGLPDLDVQHVIASILSAYDDLIENNRRRIQLLEQAARLLYREWFVYLRFPGHEHIKIKDGVPEGWKKNSLGDLVNIRKGKNITKDTANEGEVPVVAGGLTPAYFHDTSNAIAPVITISASGANAGYVNIYHEDIWASDCSYISKEAVDYPYYYYQFLISMQKEIFGLQRGAAQPHVYPKDLMQISMINPSNKVIRLFEEIVSCEFLLINNLIKQNKSLGKARDILLPRLMNGEVAV